MTYRQSSFYFAIFASSDHVPAPTINKKIEASSIDQSARASCAISQNPYAFIFGREKRQKPWPSRMGIFVEMIATIMFTIIGTAASRVSNHVRSRNADLNEAPDAESRGEQKLLESFREENAASDQTHQHVGGWRARLKNFSYDDAHDSLNLHIVLVLIELDELNGRQANAPSLRGLILL